MHFEVVFTVIIGPWPRNTKIFEKGFHGLLRITGLHFVYDKITASSLQWLGAMAVFQRHVI